MDYPPLPPRSLLVLGQNIRTAVAPSPTTVHVHGSVDGYGGVDGEMAGTAVFV